MRYSKNQLWFQDKCCACCMSSIDLHFKVIISVLLQDRKDWGV